MVADTRTLRIDVKDNVSMPVKKMSKTLDDLKRATIGMADTFDKAQREVDQLGDEFKDTGDEAKKTETKFQRLRKSAMSLKGAFIGIGAGLVAKEFLTLADKSTQMNNKLKLVTSTTKELNFTTGALFALSQKNRVGFEGTVDLYSRLARSTKDLNISQKELLTVTDVIGQTVTLSGASAEQASASLMQLGQGFASGVLRGEELNSVLEQTPRLAEAIANGMGKSVGQLRKLGAEGELTSEKIVSAIMSQQEIVRTEFDQTEATLSQSFDKINNSLLKFASGIDDVLKVTTTLATALSAVSSALDSLSEQAPPQWAMELAKATRASQAVGTTTTLTPSGVDEGRMNALGLIAKGANDVVSTVQDATFRDKDITAGIDMLDPESEKAMENLALIQGVEELEKVLDDAVDKLNKARGIAETRPEIGMPDYEATYNAVANRGIASEEFQDFFTFADNFATVLELDFDEVAPLSFSERLKEQKVSYNEIANVLGEVDPMLKGLVNQLGGLAKAFSSGSPLEKGLALFETAHGIFSAIAGSASEANRAMAELNKKVRELTEGANDQALKNNPAFAGTVDALTDPFEVLFNAILARFMDIDTLANVASQRGISIEEAKIVQQQGAVEAFYGAVGDVGVERDEQGRFIRPRGSSQKIRDIGEIERLQGTGKAEQILDSRQLDQIITETFGDLGQFTERIKTFFGADASWIDVATEALAGMDAFDGLSSSIERTNRASKALTETESRVARLRFQGEAIQARTDLARDMRMAGGDVYLQQQVMSRFQSQIESIGKSADLASRGGGAGGVGGAGGTDGMGSTASSAEYEANPENVRGKMNTAKPIYNNAINDFANSFDTVIVDLSDFIDFTATGIRGQIISAVEDAIADRAIG